MKQLILQVLADLFFAAVIIFLAVAISRAAVPPRVEVTGLEWRGIGFIYLGGKYDRAADILERGYPDQESCLEALKDAISRIPHLTIVGGCIQVPLIKQATET